MEPTSHSISLDAARGLAAVLVLIGHVRGIFLVDYGTVVHSSGLLAGVYLLTSLGHRAVVVFFVLSGYLIGSAVLRSVIDNEWKWAAYLLSRLTRLWVVLLPALVLAAGWDALGQQLSAAAFYHHAVAADSVLTFDISQRDSLTTFLGNVVFLQEILVRPFGSDSALWSLSYEFWYYLAFPLLLLSAVGRASLGRRIGYAVLGVGILVFAGFTIAEYFLLWLLGASLAFIVIRRPVLTTQPLAVPILLVSAAALLFVSFAPPLRTSFGGDVMWAIATFALIAATRCRPGSQPMPRLYQIVSIALAGCSYTLYLVHVPVLTFLRAVITPSARWQPSASSLLACGAITIAILAHAYLLALVTERQTARVRRWLAGALPSRLGLRKPTQQASVTG